jgi:hypothetical protein
MMSDPVDKKIQEVGYGIGGWLVGLVAAITWGKVQQQLAEGRTFRLPNSLQVSNAEKDFAKPKSFFEKNAENPTLSTLFALGVYVPFVWVFCVIFSARLYCPPFPVLWIAVWIFLGLKMRGAREKMKKSIVEVVPVAPLKRENAHYYDISVPKGIKWHPENAGHLIEQLLIRSEHLSFQIVSDAGVLSWRVFDHIGAIERDLLEQTIEAIFPKAEVREVADEANFTAPFYRRTMAFRLFDPQRFFFPLLHVNDIGKDDPLLSFLREMSRLQEGERMVLTISATDTANFAYDQAERVLSIKAGNPFDIGADIYRAALSLKEPRVSVFSHDEDAAIYSKYENLMYQAVMTLQTDASSPARIEQLSNIVTQLNRINNQHAELTFYDRPIIDKRIESEHQAQISDSFALLNAWLTNRDTSWMNFRLILDTQEIASFWHLPHEGITNLDVSWASAVPQQVRTSEEGVSIPVGTAPNNSKDLLSISRNDRKYHAYITGQTGMGKSTLMHNLIHRDIADGCGVAVVDPHGTLVSDVLSTSIPKTRLDDVVLLRCANVSYPVPLNPFRVPEGVNEISVFNSVLWIFKSIYANSWSETRMETTMRNILQVVLSDPQATPLDLQELVNNPNYRRKIISRLKQAKRLSRASINFWRDFENLSSNQQHLQTQSVLSRLSAFLGSSHIELMTCHPNTLDFRALIREKKIVLIDLSGDALKSEVGNLGAIFFANFFLASESLGALEGGEDPRFYLYVDETQRFITTAIPDMFSEARKFGLSLTLANQYIGQLDGETQSGISNNVGTKFSFEAAPEEAQKTAKLYEPYVTAEEIIKLGIGKAALRTRWQGETIPSFITATLPRPKATNDTEVDPTAIEQRSRENLGLVTRQEVEDFLEKRYDSDLFNAPPDDASAGLTDFE